MISAAEPNLVQRQVKIFDLLFFFPGWPRRGSPKATHLRKAAHMLRQLTLATLVAFSAGFAPSLPLPRAAQSRSRPALAMCSGPGDQERVPRRVPVQLAALGLLTLPAVASADEAAELEALKRRAAEISGLIEKTKSASLPDAPVYNKAVPAKAPAPEAPQAAAASGADDSIVVRPGPKPDASRTAKDVVKLLLEGLVNNDQPSPDAGLKTALAFSSPANPYSSQPPERFIQAMRNSGYSILLGGYEEARVGKPQEGQDDQGVSYKTFPIKVQASNRAFLIAGVEAGKYLYPAGEQGKSVAIFNWVLSEDPKTKCWLLDTVYLVKKPDADE